MANADSLPLDIVLFIARYTTTNKKFLTAWKHGLQFLAICQGWRSIGLSFIYKRAIIEIVSGDVFDDMGYNQDAYEPRDFQAFTNIRLFKGNGFNHLAKELIITYDDHYYYYPSLYFLAQSIGLRRNEFPFIEDLNCLYDFERAGTNGDVEEDDVEGARLAARELAYHMHRTFPNVNSLDISAKRPAGDALEFLVALLRGYANRLFSYAVYSDSELLINFDSPSLRMVCLDMSCYNDVDRFCINAKHLRHISMDVSAIPFSWRQFHDVPENNSMTFDNLKCLTLYNPTQSNTDLDCTNSHGGHIDVQLPKLAKLKIVKTVLSDKDYQCVFDSPIKTLLFEGTITTALKICKHKIGVLDKLSFEFKHVDEGFSDKDVVLSLNRIFSKTDKIDTVHCKIDIEQFDIDMSCVSWIYLTHLELGTVVDLKSAVDIISHLPNLVDYTLIFHTLDDERVSKFVKFLESLETDYAPLADSTLEILRLCRQGSADTKWAAEFVDSVENLRWYLPSLKGLVLSGL